MTASLRDRVLSRLVIEPETGCLLWTGSVNGAGYGQLYADCRTQVVHRLMYELLVGPIPRGYQIDHLCRVRLCASPAHLEAVTPRENLERSWSARGLKDRCLRGHAYDEANTYRPPAHSVRRVGRVCRECSRERRRAARAVA